LSMPNPREEFRYRRSWWLSHYSFSDSAAIEWCDSGAPSIAAPG
jgi:hypothetical protein